MSQHPTRLDALEAFFDGRARSISAHPTRQELCYVSGRDPRLWGQAALYENLIESIREQLAIEPCHSVLEVGCAAGFLAAGVAPVCGRYSGVDLARAAVRRARSLGLSNARFRVADATKLPFADGTFDRAFSYDVFTNLPDMAVAGRIVAEMLRVVRPGGLALVGSLADKSRDAEHAETVRRVGAELDRRFGPVPSIPPPGLVESVHGWVVRRLRRVEPAIVTYSFERRDFESLGARLGAVTRILDIHSENPYRGVRFNVLFVKPIA